MKRFVLLVCILTLSASAAWAEGKVYTLEECIQMALDSDPTVIENRNSISNASATVWQQYGNLLPSASFGMTSSQTYRGPIKRLEWVGQEQIYVENPNWEYFKSYSGGFSFNQTLFDGFQNIWNIKGSKASKRQVEQRYQTTKSNVIFRVKTDYYLVLKAKNDLDVAHEAVKRSEELLKLFQEKYDLGSASLSEVLKQKVQYGNDRLTLVTAERLFEVRIDQLAVDIGVDPSIEMDIQDLELREEPIKELSVLIQDALRSHPAIMASLAGIDAYKYDVRSAWGEYLPRLSLGYSYSWGNDFFSELSDDVFSLSADNSSASLRLSLSFTIFDGFGRERNKSRAQNGLNSSRASLVYVRNSVIKDIEEAHLGVRLAEETLSLTEETERSADEDMELVQEKYNLGAAALWELLDAQVSLKQAQFLKVKAEFDYNLALAQLQNAIGE
jgi:outer membrane protein